MGGKFSRSWELTKESWRVLRADKTLVLFPFISSIALLAVLATFAVPVVIALLDAGVFEGKVSKDQPLPVETRVILTIVGFAYYFVSFTVMNFFNVALVGAAMERFEGRDAGVRVGLSIAVRRIPQILLWSLVAATVGMILKAIEERVGIFGKIAVALVGMAWAIASFFVVPVLAVEGLGPFAAIKRSVAVLKKSWGEAALTRIGVGVVFGLATLVVLFAGIAVCAFAVLSLNSIVLGGVVGGITLLLIVGISLISTTLQTIVQAAVYRFAAHETVPVGFSASTLRGVFAPKKTR
jgi:Family of unknown function (DUF6159)